MKHKLVELWERGGITFQTMKMRLEEAKRKGTLQKYKEDTGDWNEKNGWRGRERETVRGDLS